MILRDNDELTYRPAEIDRKIVLIDGSTYRIRRYASRTYAFGRRSHVRIPRKHNLTIYSIPKYDQNHYSKELSGSLANNLSLTNVYYAEDMEGDKIIPVWPPPVGLLKAADGFAMFNMLYFTLFPGLGGGRRCLGP